MPETPMTTQPSEWAKKKAEELFQKWLADCDRVMHSVDAELLVERIALALTIPPNHVRGEDGVDRTKTRPKILSMWWPTEGDDSCHPAPADAKDEEWLPPSMETPGQAAHHCCMKGQLGIKDRFAFRDRQWRAECNARDARIRELEAKVKGMFTEEEVRKAVGRFYSHAASGSEAVKEITDSFITTLKAKG